jgi:protein O-GlcNAc transferase
MRKRLRAVFDDFINVRDQLDRDVAMLARREAIDIAVDLNGHQKNSRTGIFACRAAPIQVSYLAYPGSMGASYIDYLVADPTVVPASNQKYFSEKLVYLPNSYQANDRKRRIGDKAFTRPELRLPEHGFVFCCFNNNFKITPDVFDLWMRILTQVEDSVLWLLQVNASAAANLRTEARARGVDPKRLVFAERMSLPDHLARHRSADLFLDTLPYNAHTTASDALWTGLPLLTRIGQTFAARVAAGLLTAVGLPELITSTPQAYEELAVELATNPDKLATIKQKLANNRLTMPLFDTELFSKHIEAAYTAMYARYHAGVPPDHIYVPN